MVANDTHPGRVPTEIGQLTRLEDLNVASNELHGTTTMDVVDVFTACCKLAIESQNTSI